MPTNYRTDVMILLKKDWSFPVEVQQERVEKFVVFRYVKPIYNVVEMRIAKIVFGFKH
jgi:hypothetical protein